MTPTALPPAAPLGAAGRVRLVLEIVAAYAVVRRSLAHRTLPETLAGLRTDRAPAELPGGRALEEGRRIGRAVERTLRCVPGDTRCLTASLVLCRLLERRGIPTSLVIGVATGSGLDAHAWIEHYGRPLLPTGGAHFRRLTEL